MCGKGVEANKQEGIRLYRAVALQGYAPAQFWLGCFYFSGIGFEMNKLMGACLFKMAADIGYQNALRLKEPGLSKVMLADVIDDVQDELAIVDALCNAASDASDETREAALQWLLTQHHDEVSMLVCD
jgi:TPR repeat protein